MLMQSAAVHTVSSAPDRVLVVGGGVAGLEALLTLRELGSGELKLQLLSASRMSVLCPELVNRAWSGPSVEIDLVALCDELGVRLHTARHTAFHQQTHTAWLSDGDSLHYDKLLVASGAASIAPYTGVSTLGAIMLAEHLAALRPGRLSIVVPPGVAWTTPAYQVALLAAGTLSVGVEVITPERRPLELFGDHASAMVSELLDDAGVEVLPPHSVPQGSDLFALLDNAIALPVTRGPAISGLPSDAAGFLPVDALGRVIGATDVHAAGDVTGRELRVGGLAAQDGGVAAADIAGVAATPASTVRVLSGELVAADGSAVYLRRVLDGEDAGLASHVPLRRPRSAVDAWHLEAWLEHHGDQPTQTPVAV